MEPVAHYTSLIKQAKEAEEDGNIDEATSLYEKAIKQRPMLEQPYNRLMVIYRKKKQYKQELRVLNKALELYITHHDKKKEALMRLNKVRQLSNALLKAVGQGTVAHQMSIQNLYANGLKGKPLLRRR